MIGSQLIVGAIASAVVLACIVLHYEVMSWFTRGPWHREQPERWHMVILVAALVLAHVAEVWIFGGTFWLLTGWDALGGALMTSSPAGDAVQVTSLLDCVYFSATSFTTLGFGDIVPQGALRVLTGAEALAGLSLVTWSASFTFLEMQRHWSDEGTGS